MITAWLAMMVGISESSRTRKTVSTQRHTSVVDVRGFTKCV